MRATICTITALLMHVSLLAAEPAKAPTEVKVPIKVAAGWSWPKELKETSAKVLFAKSLGFNAMIWCSKSSEAEFVNECKKNNIKPVKILEPLAPRYGTRLQKMTAEDRKRSGKHELFQHGGEPADGQTDILDKKLLCPGDDKIVENVIKDVKKAIELGYKGICLDFIGYRNLRSCECSHCREKLKALTGKEAAKPEEFYEKQLVSLYSRLQKGMKKSEKAIITMCHIHPVYLPNIFYGSKLDIDYCAVTCSWFFKPHWSKAKISAYLKRVYGSRNCMPMIGYYQSGPMAKHAKDDKQIDTEFELLRKYKNSSIMVCELGSIYGKKHLSRQIQLLLK